MDSKRYEWIDYGKGIGIILVVYGHLLSSGFHARLPFSEVFFTFSDSIVYSFHMPLFFFLSGLLVEKSITKRGVGGFCRNKILVLGYPYLIWSYLQAFAEMFFAGSSHRGVSMTDLLAIPIQPLGQFWFLYALLLMYLCYAVASLGGRIGKYLLLAAAAILFFFPIQTEKCGLIGFSTGLLFFMVGDLASPYFLNRKHAGINLPAALVFMVLFAVASFCTFTFLIEPVRLTNGTHPFIFLVLALLGIGFSVGLASVFSGVRGFRFLYVLGNASLVIYLVHMLAGVGVRVILLSFLFIDNPVIHIISGTLGGLCIPLVVLWMAKTLRFPFLFSPEKQNSL